MQENITITMEEYKELIRAQQKAEQYKRYLLENTQNSRLTNLLCSIENKRLSDLIIEKREEC